MVDPFKIILTFLALMIATFVMLGESWGSDSQTCLAKNIYYETRNQPTAGQFATAFVTFNRVKDHRYPNDVCEVITQGPARPSWLNPKKMIPLRHKCQFSWYCDGKSDKPKKSKAWDKAQKIARLFLDPRTVIVVDISELDDMKLPKGAIVLIDITGGATHYHADYVQPAWASHMDSTVEIEDHKYYIWEK